MKKIIIVGGGIAGLTSSILLQRRGFEVLLFEKKKYPFHRVCGEYVSNEALTLLKSIGIHPSAHGASSIQQLSLSTTFGASLKCDLGLGGFGISRFKLDQLLYERALEEGVTFHFEKVSDISFHDEKFTVIGTGTHSADLVISCHGKRSNLDQKFGRRFFLKRSPYMGIKYHIRADIPVNLIRLDNFPGGYAGICKIESDLYNLCYLTKTSNLKNAGSIKEMERSILSINPHLKDVLSNSDFVSDEPEVINEISFERKDLVDNHIIYCGDSAGMITPLCGNGMAMAMHSARILSCNIIRYCAKETIDRSSLERDYQNEWNSLFARRIRTGRIIQSFFGFPALTDLAFTALQRMPAISKKLIAQTHGREIDSI